MTNLSSSTECKCRDRHIECLDCSFGDHDEHCQPDTTTQGDDSQPISQDAICTIHGREGCFHKLPHPDTEIEDGIKDEQIQTKGVRLHSQKDGNTLDTKPDTGFTALDSTKDQIAEILANQYGMILLPAVDELAALFPVEREHES